jgi:hypothetical protein
MHLFVHTHGSDASTRIEIDTDGLVGELQVGDGKVWVADSDEPLDVNLSVHDAGLRDHQHVHCGPCASIKVSVRFNGSTVAHSFRPAVSVATVLAWATGPNGFGLASDQVPKHTLIIVNADSTLAPGTHVGSLVPHGSCEVVVDLVPKVRFEG